ncbi:MAG: PsiF family protein [Hyphomicrobiaceae bacterium]
MKILNMRNALIATVFAVASATAAAAQGTTTQTPPPAPAAKMAPAAKTAPAAPAKTAKVRDPSKPRSAASIECSKQADAKGLHGKERKTFRAACKKDMTKHS